MYLKILLLMSSSWMFLITLPISMLSIREVICVIDNCRGNIPEKKVPSSFTILVIRNEKIIPINIREIKNGDTFNLKEESGEDFYHAYTYYMKQIKETQYIYLYDLDNGNEFEYQVYNNEIAPTYYRIMSNGYVFYMLLGGLIIVFLIRDMSRKIIKIKPPQLPL